MEWFYASGSNRVGPVKPEEFEGAIKTNVVTGETLVWSKGMGDWLPYSQVAADTAVCAASGGRYWQRDMIPYEGKFISAEHKEQYFQRLREGITQPNQMVYGNFGRRFVAKFTDGIITGIVNAITNLILAKLFFGAFIWQPKISDPAMMGRFMGYQGMSFLVSTSFGLAYYWYFLRHHEATPGKMALGLKVVRSDGSRLTTGRIIGRFFAEWLSAMILGIGYLMAGFDAERRTLHDRICDTRVIKTR